MLYKEKLDNLLYAAFNVYSDAAFNLGRNKKIAKRNEVFRNIHKGQRCFILGTGPSLRDLDPNLLSNEIVMGVNFLYKSKVIMNTITPKYYFLIDHIFHGSAIDSTIEVINKLPNTIFFLRTKAYPVMKKLGLTNDQKLYYQHCNYIQYKDKVRVDLTNNITAPFNVVLASIQTAIFMGFKEIYLLGCDFNSFASHKVEHCYDENESPDRTMSLGFELKYYSMVSYHHYALEKHARQNGVDIINLTPNSLLDAYRKSSVSDVFSKGV